MNYEEKVNGDGFIYWQNKDTDEIIWENPNYQTGSEQNQFDSQTYEYVSENNEWVLYYDEEGNGYWYNETTGESEWAEPEAEETTGNDDDDDDESDDESDDDDDDSDDDDDDSDDESSYESDSEEDDDLELKFQAMLNTPEGREALEAEKMAILEEEAAKSLRKREAQNRYLDQSVPSINISNAQEHGVINIDDIEAGVGFGESGVLRGRKVNNSNGSESDQGSLLKQVRFTSDKEEPEGTLSDLWSKWDSMRSTCRQVTRGTRLWFTKTLQGALIGAFSFAKYSLEYAEALTADERLEREEEEEEEEDSSESEPEEPSRVRPKPPTGRPPSSRPPLPMTKPQVPPLSQDRSVQPPKPPPRPSLTLGEAVDDNTPPAPPPPPSGTPN
eukprot:CAMPEP_0114344162 /NCGR_PEP_ID=MMETSP0101-20121206/11204_1 /TAXON_ID=38822 ORGANISM="Pteridomonas danica, Strain PT" /NCGR_SAMPLE_ID=MMETSP0101 /ASSEMBLY_ACC=CAM_ASM_000211 /LENGTH=386 /DNA_ID=CAMNT_0001479355 /DNA_START=90 /DNA_END=1250 /DNA_ORIENTATION=-